MTALHIERCMNFGLGRAELQPGKPIIGIARPAATSAPATATISSWRSGSEKASARRVASPSSSPFIRSGRRASARPPGSTATSPYLGARRDALRLSARRRDPAFATHNRRSADARPRPTERERPRRSGLMLQMSLRRRHIRRGLASAFPASPWHHELRSFRSTPCRGQRRFRLHIRRLRFRTGAATDSQAPTARHLPGQLRRSRPLVGASSRSCHRSSKGPPHA